MPGIADNGDTPARYKFIEQFIRPVVHSYVSKIVHKVDLVTLTWARFMPATALEKCFTVLVEKSRGGRPSKGRRQLLGTRPPLPLAKAARNRADELGMTMSDYLVTLIARDLNLPPSALPQKEQRQDESPSHTEVLEAFQYLMDTIQSEGNGVELVLRVAVDLIQNAGTPTHAPFDAQGTQIESGDFSAE
ncbi:hypothetical protein [Homoserinimonas sp. A520]